MRCADGDAEDGRIGQALVRCAFPHTRRSLMRAAGMLMLTNGMSVATSGDKSSITSTRAGVIRTSSIRRTGEPREARAGDCGGAHGDGGGRSFHRVVFVLGAEAREACWKLTLAAVRFFHGGRRWSL